MFGASTQGCGMFLSEWCPCFRSGVLGMVVASGLLCLPLPVWDLHPMKELGWGWLGPKYSLSHPWGRAFPFWVGMGETRSLETLGCTYFKFVLFCMQVGVAEMGNAGGLLLPGRYHSPQLGVWERRRPYVVHNAWTEKGEGVGHGSDATDSCCSEF